MKRIVTYSILLNALVCCSQEVQLPISVPSMEYSNKLRQQTGGEGFKTIGAQPQPVGYNGAVVAAPAVAWQSPQIPQAAAGANVDDTRGQLRMVKDDSVVSNEGEQGYRAYPSTQPNIRDYSGPLALGDPGVSASLWKESRGDNDIFRDERAWRPMDLLTIVVTESAEGSKQADTEVKSKSTVAAGISDLFSLDNDVAAANAGVNPTTLVQADTQNDFKGQGSTTRKGKLTARISAMVAEVLPSGILRVEGEKIISVNNEEQIMKISGLVRTRDITTANEVDSAKVADMRIDYYGRGTVGEAQVGGWLGRWMRILWPF